MKLSNLFSEGAVLQRRQPIAIWGWAKPGDSLTIEFGELIGYAEAGDHGKFECQLPALEANDLARTLKVTNGVESVEVRDLVVGEVWLASGQSNMAWTMEQSGEGLNQFQPDDLKGLRVFKVGTCIVPCQLENPIGCWEKVSCDSSGDYSAVATFFALKLMRELQIPVGIIESSHGGTAIEAWSRRQSLLENPYYAPRVQRYGQDVHANPSLKERDEKEGLPKDPGTDSQKNDHLPSPSSLDALATMDLPCPWQEAGLDHSGVIWFYKEVTIPSDWVDKDLELHLGAIEKHDQVWVNGNKVGSTGKGLEDEHIETLRRYKVPSSITAKNTLIVAVRVYSFLGQGGMVGPKEEMKLCGTEGSVMPLSGIWSYRVEHDFGRINLEKPLGRDRASSPHLLYDTMIKPLQPYGLGGVIWYQGERDASQHHRYRKLLEDMIGDWRREWGLPELPFGIVQLPNYNAAKAYDSESTWAHLRQAQLETSQNLKGVGLSVTIDLGEATNIHPNNKKPVGERLAQWALAEHFGKAEVAGGPIIKRHTLEGSSIRLYFDHLGKGLSTTDGLPPSGFWIQDRNLNWFEAGATIEGTTVVVECSKVGNPVRVRYAWANNPKKATLCNMEGFPASPFSLA